LSRTDLHGWSALLRKEKSTIEIFHVVQNVTRFLKISTILTKNLTFSWPRKLMFPQYLNSSWEF